MGDVTEELAKRVRETPDGEGKYLGDITVVLDIDTDTFDYGNHRTEGMSDEDKAQFIIEEIHGEFWEIAHGSNEVRQHFVIFEEGLMKGWEGIDLSKPVIDAVKERMKELGITEAVVWLGE